MLQSRIVPRINTSATSSAGGCVSVSESLTIGNLDSHQTRVSLCRALDRELRSATPIETSSLRCTTATLSIKDSLTEGVVGVIRSDDPLLQPVNPGWLVGACRASLQECEAAVVLSARQLAADDDLSPEYTRLKHLAARLVMLISASMNQGTRPTALSREVWTATANVCDVLFVEAGNFPFDGWVTRSAEGCRQLAEVLRRAAVAGVELPAV